MHVLIVDDDDSVRELISSIIVAEGWETSSAGDGEAALHELEAHPVDVILLDLQMPVMDGWTFFRKLRALPSSVPVLIMSAQGSSQARRELGAEDALDKPFDPDALIEHVRALAPAASR
jgi:DNA-binding response OmpR family regulator